MQVTASKLQIVLSHAQAYITQQQTRLSQPTVGFLAAASRQHSV